MAALQGIVGVQGGSQGLPTGTTQTGSLDKQGGILVSELNGRFYGLNYNGNLFSGGMTTTSISNATFTTATLGATGTPIVGVWNPAGSGVNLVILQAVMTLTITAATTTGPGTFQWCSSTGNLAAITTALQPWSRKTLLQSGSLARNVSGVALTGLTNNQAVMHASSLAGGSSANFSFVGTAVGQATVQVTAVENLDGSIIVPPGGVLSLLCTTTPVAHSAGTAMLWAEIPV